MSQIIGRLIMLLMLAILVTPGLMTQIVLGQTRSVALLTQPEGDVRIHKKGRRDAPKIRDDVLLDVGDEIRVSEDGTGVVYQAYVPVTRNAENPNRNGHTQTRLNLREKL